MLDVSLPGEVDGFERCHRWGTAGVAVPIMFLTARDDVGDRVHGLDLGVDDYCAPSYAVLANSASPSCGSVISWSIRDAAG